MRKRRIRYVFMLGTALIAVGLAAGLRMNPERLFEAWDREPAATSGVPGVAALSPPAAGRLSVYYLDVGQGDATYIRTPEGDDVLIDGGKNEAGETVVSYLKQLGVDDLEIMIATHPDADHIGGLDTVLGAFDVKAVYAPRVSHTTDTYRDFLLAVKAEGLAIKEAKAGAALPLRGVEAELVAPVAAYGDDLNDWSAVLRLVYGRSAFLFTGDAEARSEADMLDAGETLRADVLKVGHHGASTSTSPDFLQAVSPAYAVISVGRNSYGHPTAETLRKLKAAGVTVLRTDRNGTVTAVSDGEAIAFSTTKDEGE